MKVYLVLSINGDFIGIADSYDKAIELYNKRYGDVDINNPQHKEERIIEFEVNKFYYKR